MPHFSKGQHTFEQIDTSKHYRLSGWINIENRTWNDASKSYEPRTKEQIDAQREIYELMKKHGAGIQVNVHERMDGLEPKDFPIKQRITLFVNKYDSVPPSSAAPAPVAPSAPVAPAEEDMGWG